MKNNKTIAESLNIKEFPFEIFDKNGNLIYYEDSNKYWEKREYNQNGKLIYFENSNKSWWKREYDQNGNLIYHENSNKFWVKREFDQNGKEIYYETSKGQIIDNRPKNVELTMDEIAKAFNIPVENLKIKK